MKKSLLILSVLLWSLVGSWSWANSAPDLYTLKQAGFIMGPGQLPSYPIDKSWAKDVELMKNVTIFDDVASRIERVICGEERNKGVLIVGEPSDTYRYVFARLAARTENLNCPKLWHVEVDITKIEAGNRYVGDVEAYWERNIKGPSMDKDVVMYFRSLGRIIGLGAHSNDSTGIESEYAANITSGKMRTISFITKYEYNNLLASEHSYVLGSFAEVILLKQPSVPQVKELIEQYMKVNVSHAQLGEEELELLLSMTQYYRPNHMEPQRSLEVLNHMIRHYGDSFDESTYQVNMESAHPYEPSKNIRYELNYPDAAEIQVVFEEFESEEGRDHLVFLDGNRQNFELRKFSGALGKLRTPYFPTNRLIMEFRPDNTVEQYGFKVKEVRARRKALTVFTRENVRRSVLEVAQVPEWLVERDWTVLRELPQKLNGDVIAAYDAKKHLVNQLENGLVTGRTDEKPIGSVLFVGPTGLGKSYISKAVAEYLGMKLITVDMTSYRSDESFDRFQELMSNYLTLYPFAFYLFEEIDKASVKILDRLYFMLDEGIFYDKYQRPLFARGAFIIMTTNAAEHILTQRRNDPEIRRLVNEELQKHFRASFLNRFNDVSLFFPFTDDEFKLLANTLVNKKLKKLRQHFKWQVNVDQQTLHYIWLKGRSALYGARPMERLIENVITTGLTKFQLYRENLPANSQVKFVKLEKENEFRVQVEGRGFVEFEADPDVNTGLMSISGAEKLQEFFEQIRMY